MTVKGDAPNPKGPPPKKRIEMGKLEIDEERIGIEMRNSKFQTIREHEKKRRSRRVNRADVKFLSEKKIGVSKSPIDEMKECE